MGAFDDLIPQSSAGQQSNYFSDLIPQASASAVQGASAPIARESGAIADIGPEMQATLSGHLSNIQNMYGGTADKGVLQQTMDVGKGLASMAGIIPDTFIGAPARSVLGHGMADIEHATGLVINPQVAAQDNLQEMYQTAKGDVDTALAALAPRGALPLGLRTSVPTIPTAAELKTAATTGYNAAKNSGVEFAPSSIRGFAAKTQADLNADGLNDITAPKTLGVLDRMSNPPAGAVITTNDFRSMQRALGQVARSADPTERLASGRAIEALNNHIENISPADLVSGTPADAAGVSQTIKEANANYKASKLSEQFDLRREKAQNNADAANSGMNLENNLRTQVRQILNNPKLQRGYDPETLAAFRAFNRGSRGANVLRAVGNAFGGGGGLGAIVSGGIGHLLLPGGGEAAPAVGFAIKALGNAGAAKQFEQLNRMIRANSPLAKSVPPSVAPQFGPIGNTMASGLLSSIAPRALFPYLGQMPTYADENNRR